MGKALYRKYRSRSLEEVVGQEHVTTTLANALKNDTVSHAYLLTGPKGVGKTSIARILAHEVNKLPYSDDAATHLDIIEIDAASNNGVEHVRELRDKAHITPSSAPHKVYIIDEVHMLSKPAFNALLKILEEPPKHVIFILATTETHKLPETIISRTQRFSLKPISSENVISHLKKLAKEEKISIDDEALSMIADHGGGSFRDSISLLDQVANATGTVTAEDIRRTLGIAPSSALDAVLDAIATGSTKDIVAQISSLKASGYQAPQVAKQLAAHLRTHLIDNTGSLDRPTLTRALKALLEVPPAHDPQTALEIALIELALQIDTSAIVAPVHTAVAVSKPAPTVAAPKPAKVTPVVTKEVIEAPAQEAAAEEVAESSVPATSEKVVELVDFDPSIWGQVLDAIKKQHNTLYSCARMAVPTIDGDTLVLAFAFPFHQKKMNDAKPKQMISQVVQELTGKSIAVSCIIKENAKPAATAVAAPSSTSQPLEAISNIFGGAEVLES